MCDSRSLFQGPGSEALRLQDLGECACNRDTPILDEAALREYMVALPAWQLNETNSVLRRSFVAKNFVAAIEFFNNVKVLAEEQGHHPDLHLTNYRDVEVVLSTHAIGALSLHDIVLAAKIDNIDVAYSPKWLKAQQGSES